VYFEAAQMRTVTKLLVVKVNKTSIELTRKTNVSKNKKKGSIFDDKIFELLLQ